MAALRLLDRGDAGYQRGPLPPDAFVLALVPVYRGRDADHGAKPHAPDDDQS